MNYDFKDIVTLINGIIYPVIILVFILFFRKAIIQFLAKAAGQMTKLSIPNLVSMEFAQASEFRTKWSAPHLSDVRQPTPSDEFSSGALDLMNQIRNDTAADYSVINLGIGEKWLTSRLFIFAILLQRMRGLRCFVFVETNDKVRRRFVGLADPTYVRWVLAHQYPWLERSFAKAYAEISNLNISVPNGALEPLVAAQLAQHYLKNIQQTTKPTKNLNEWVRVGNKQIWEHAKWIDGAEIEQTLDMYLIRSYVIANQTTTSEDLVKIALSKDGPFVAIVNEEHRFDKLIDHTLLSSIFVNKMIMSK